MSSWTRSWGRTRTRSLWSWRRGASRVEFTARVVEQKPWITIEQYRSVSFFLAFLDPWRVEFTRWWWIWAFCPSFSKQRLVNICWWKLYRFISSQRTTTWMWRNWRCRWTGTVKQQRFRRCFGFSLSTFNPWRFKWRNTNRLSRFRTLSKERFVDRRMDEFHPAYIRRSHASETTYFTYNSKEIGITMLLSRRKGVRSYTLHFLLRIGLLFFQLFFRVFCLFVSVTYESRAKYVRARPSPEVWLLYPGHLWRGECHSRPSPAWPF